MGLNCMVFEVIKPSPPHFTANISQSADLFTWTLPMLYIRHCYVLWTAVRWDYWTLG